MQTIKLLAGQCIVDIAMQEAGTMEALFDVANLNDLSATEDIQSGSDIITPDVVDKKIVKVFAGNLKPASSITQVMKPGGIDYMQIGNDFKVR